MDRLRKLWTNEQPYEPISSPPPAADEDPNTTPNASPKKPPFSWLDYTIFLLLGIAMLWAWNMFLAAGPYFLTRFTASRWISDNFQAAEVSVSTVANLGSMWVLTKMQEGASYPKRIIVSLGINMVVFLLLALSTSVGRGVGAEGYFAFLLVMILSTSLATGLCQNGIFAFVAGFGEMRYTQGIMTGQAVAGVLPCIAQIVSVLSVQGKDGGVEDDEVDRNRKRGDGDGDGQEAPGTVPAPPVNSTAALAYFLTATAIAVIALFAFFILLARHRQPARKTTHATTTEDHPDSEPSRKEIPLTHLARKLRWLSSAVFLTFAITMVFPVFTQRITSVRPPNDQPPLLQPPSFIPLAFLLWNTGDLLGRLLTAVPALSLVHRPRLVFALSISRLAFVGLYHLCNIRGQGAMVESDFFYLVVVQGLFGLSNGFLGSTCMIGAGEWVDEEEREAAGGFMGLCLVGGLAVGSLASFFVAGA